MIGVHFFSLVGIDSIGYAVPIDMVVTTVADYVIASSEIDSAVKVPKPRIGAMILSMAVETRESFKEISMTAGLKEPL